MRTNQQISLPDTGHAGRVLIVEDEAVIRAALRRLLERGGYVVVEAASVGEAEAAQPSGFDLIISDLRLPGGKGTEIIERSDGVPVLIMTSYASVPSAVECMKKGAADYIAKPFDHEEMLLVVQRIIRQNRLLRQHAVMKTELEHEYPVSGLVGSCAAIEEVRDHIRKVAPTSATVLIAGESGTGKELVARAIHEFSARSDGPFITVNCAAIPEGLIESELFGHEKGAFTGAVTAHTGLVEAAKGGTLFLDEIGELPAAAQARLLRCLQDGEVRRVGSTSSSQVDVRMVAATNRDLQQLVDEERFRADLYFRVRVMEIYLPPLRERGDDIPQLAHYLLERVCNRLNRPLLHLGPEVVPALASYEWPGNIRELENAIERAVILTEGEEPISLRLLDLGSKGESGSAVSDPRFTLEEYFCHFVRRHEQNMTETELAARLGISRKSLWERRQRMDLHRPGARRNRNSGD
ncbi:MAG: sigma-54 dependent transcriptional regulator [Gammaproteobacteria bacterium]|nr:sigma-54 dependent transcriptional regulator [Gammaproteobacteria bacterium]